MRYLYLALLIFGMAEGSQRRRRFAVQEAEWSFQDQGFEPDVKGGGGSRVQVRQRVQPKENAGPTPTAPPSNEPFLSSQEAADLLRLGPPGQRIINSSCIPP